MNILDLYDAYVSFNKEKQTYSTSFLIKEKIRHEIHNLRASNRPEALNNTKQILWSFFEWDNLFAKTFDLLGNNVGNIADFKEWMLDNPNKSCYELRDLWLERFYHKYIAPEDLLVISEKIKSPFYSIGTKYMKINDKVLINYNPYPFYNLTNRTGTIIDNSNYNKNNTVKIRVHKTKIIIDSDVSNISLIESNVITNVNSSNEKLPKFIVFNDKNRFLDLMYINEYISIFSPLNTQLMMEIALQIPSSMILRLNKDISVLRIPIQGVTTIDKLNEIAKLFKPSKCLYLPDQSIRHVLNYLNLNNENIDKVINNLKGMTI